AAFRFVPGVKPNSQRRPARARIAADCPWCRSPGKMNPTPAAPGTRKENEPHAKVPKEKPANRRQRGQRRVKPQAAQFPSLSSFASVDSLPSWRPLREARKAMTPALKQETESLARSWARHESAWLRDYLVAGVEDPRINLQSILSRHF